MAPKPTVWPAKSLKSMAMKVAVRNITGIVGVAEMKYGLVRPLLQRIIHPKQLQQIEANSPQIVPFSSELWIAFIERDIPDWKSKVENPDGPHRWSELYWKLLRADKKAQLEQEQRLEASLRATTAAEAAKKPSTQFVPKVTPIVLRQMDLLDGKKNTNRSPWGNTNRAPALKNARTGSEAIAAIRKQAKTQAKFKNCGIKGKSNTIANPVIQARRTANRTGRVPMVSHGLDLAAPDPGPSGPRKSYVFSRTPHRETLEEITLRRALEAEKLKQDAADKRRAEIKQAREEAESLAEAKAVLETGKLVDLNTPIRKGAIKVRTPNRTPSSSASSNAASALESRSISKGPSSEGLFSPSGSPSPLKGLPAVPSAGQGTHSLSKKTQQGSPKPQGPIMPPETVVEPTSHSVDMLEYSAKQPWHNGNAPPRKRPAANIFMPSPNKKRRI